MKFAICNETYRDWPLERACVDIAACGYDGVELAPFTLADDPGELDERRAAEIARIARSAGLEVVGLHWLLVRPTGPALHLTTLDEAVRRRTIAYLQHLARLCAAIGGRVLVLGSPQQRRVPEGAQPDEVLARAAEACREVCETAGPLGVTLAIEPLSPELTDFLTSADEAARLIDAVGHEACRLHLDVCAMSSEDRPIPDIVRAHSARLAHFHANDPNLRGPGTGDVDFAPIAAVLDEVGYDGCVSVEVFDYAPDGPTIARESLRYLRQVWG